MDTRCVTDAYTSLYGVNQVYQTLSLLSVLNLNQQFTPAPPVTFIHDVSQFQCDYIIVGAGASGSLLANRLTENKYNQVCLLEAGGESPLESSLPGFFPYRRRRENMWNENFIQDIEHLSFHKLQVGPLDLGKGLGGSSNIDRYMYERGRPEDYDEWARIVDDESWNHNHVLETFIKTEALYDHEIVNSEIHSKFHGTNGYLGVSKQYCDRINDYLNAFVEIGHEEVIDFSGGGIGYGRPLLTVANGTHQTAAYSFLSRLITRDNLKLMTHSEVVKITIDNANNANGVCFLDRNRDLKCITARKEVILAAGATHTPKLLMQSGIGPKSHLEENEITVISNLPVGRNLIHPREIMTFHQTGIETSENLGPYVFPDPVLIGKLSGYRTISSIVSSTLMLEYCYTGYGFAEDVCQYFYEQTQFKDIMITGITQFNPKSRGSIELKSSNYEDNLIIRLGYDSYDLDQSVEYVKDFERIYQSTYFKNIRASQLRVSRCYAYVPGSDAYIRCLVGGMGTPTGDLSGTCAMGSVVDSKLRVYRINGLRVVDASVIPIPISGSLYATTIMVAERAAEIIIKASEEDSDGSNESLDNSDDDCSDKGSKDDDSSDNDGSDDDSSGSGSDEDKSKKSKQKNSKEKKCKEKKSKEKKSKEKKSDEDDSSSSS